MTRRKTTEEILSREMITKSDIKMLFGIGERKAQDIFDKVRQKVESEGKLNIDGRVSWRRVYRMLGLPIPQNQVKRESSNQSA